MSFLTKQYGPLPAWGWGAVAAGGLLVAKAMGGGGGRPNGGHMDPPGQLSGEAEARITAGQNTGSVSAVTEFGYGPSDSRIDGSFFGNEMLDHNGPYSIGADISGYVDIFPQGMHGHRRHHHRQPGEIYGNDNVPSGAGGVGSHGPRWQGEAPPAGGEGYQNYGQSTGAHKSRNHRPIGLNYREHGRGGPHPQKTTMGTPLQEYQSQHGDTMDNVANKMWGPGQNGTLIHQANPGIAHTPSSPMRPGHMLKIPSAPPVGLAPSGVSGNGIGGGSWKQSTRSRMTSAGMFQSHEDKAPDSHTAGVMGERPQPGKGGHKNRGGRGLQRGR